MNELRKRTQEFNKKLSEQRAVEDRRRDDLAKIEIENDLENGRDVIRNLESRAKEQADRGRCRLELLVINEKYHETKLEKGVIPIKRLRSDFIGGYKPAPYDYRILGYKLNPRYLTGAAKLIYEYCKSKGLAIVVDHHYGEFEDGGKYENGPSLYLVWCED